MKIKSLLLLSLLLFLPSEVQAQSSVRLCNSATPQDCAAITGSALAVTGTISASLGGFTPSAASARMTPLSVTTSDSSGNLPTGAVVVVSNVGTTNPMYCNVNGVAATTSDQLIGANSWFAFTIPAAVTTLHCIATGGTTTANGVGGAGLATGAGGGSGGGGGGGSVTQGTTPWVVGQATASSLNATVVGTGTFATQAAQSGTWNITNISGTVSLPTGASTAAKQPALGTAGTASTDVISVQGIASMTPLLANPGTAANWGVGTATQNSASVANGQLALAQFNTSPTTITNGNMSPLQMDNSGKLLVNCTGCSASGAITTWAGGTLGAMANYGTSPGAVLVPGINAFVTNTNANGSAVSASSSPVVIASDQAAVAVKAASGAIASGAVASGAVASGAFASGAVASGAYASGSLASGAVVDLTNISAAPAAAPPSKVIAMGANASGATGGQMANIIQCDSSAIYDASTNGRTQLVALTSGRTIYVCGYSILSAGTVNVNLVYGTGSACVTGTTAITPAYQLTTQVGLVDGSPFFRGLKTALANALCLNTSAGVAVQAIVYYAVL